jgi:hypothetical protein
LVLALSHTRLALATYPAASAAESAKPSGKDAPSKREGNAQPEAPAIPSKPPSIAETKSVTFLGKKFDLKFHPAQQVVPLYEYYPGQDRPETWMELVDFRIYPVNPSGNAPVEHAKRTAAEFKKKYPYMKFALYEDKKSAAALLDFFYPAETGKDEEKSFLEFNAFKFFSDPNTGKTISFHYAKKIESTSDSRDSSDVLADIKKTRAEIVPAMVSFPVYTQ